MEIKKAVIMHSRSSCEKHKWKILEEILKEKIDLFCVFGIDCALWEEVMDETIVGDGTQPLKNIVTTSHQGQSIEEVKKFAVGFFPKNKVEILVVEI